MGSSTSRSPSAPAESEAGIDSGTGAEPELRPFGGDAPTPAPAPAPASPSPAPESESEEEQLPKEEGGGL